MTMNKPKTTIVFLLGIAYLLLVNASLAAGAAERIVVIKADGLPFGILDSFVQKKDPYSGKSVLPWIDHVFYSNGTRLSNFHSRGLSLSAQSWSMLDSGQPSVIKGNLEYDRLTLEAYDYLNMFSFVLRNAAGRRTNTPGIRVLDEQGIPVLSDAYEPTERSLSTQLYIRGLPVPTTGGLKRLLTLQNPKEWFDEWLIGLEGEQLLVEISERELLTKLKNPAVRYLDISVPFFDHTAHRNRDPEAQLYALQQIDSLVRNIWTAIEESALASTTALILVSDHGINTHPETYSQGYNLIDLFGSAAGGGHHTLTHRPPLSEYSLKSLSPTVPQITIPSRETYYLKGQAGDYPTFLLDADGNERASIYLRHSDLNVLQILWQQLRRKEIRDSLRRAATDAFFEVVKRNRATWGNLRLELEEELAAVRRSIVAMEKSLKSPESKKRKAGEDRNRIAAQIASADSDEQKYRAYVRTLANLLELDTEDFDPWRSNIEAVLAKKSLGQLNSVHDLQNYVVGIGRNGLVLNSEGSLDFVNSFVRIDYFALMRDLRARNNVQDAVVSKPVDFVATGIPGDAISFALGEKRPVENAVWIYEDEESQALILIRHGRDNGLELRYMPVRNLAQDRMGGIHVSRAEWGDGLPLAVWESLRLPVEQRKSWLDEWHADVEWLERLHAGPYSNAVVSLAEQFTFTNALVEGGSIEPDDQLLFRFRQRKRKLAQADFIIFANNHWNFNFRGFNPGGNHGSFLRDSTHATLMFAGGNQTRIPRGLQIDQAYDSLSLVPTVLALTGRTKSEPFMRKLKQRGFVRLPGPIIRELFPKL